MANYDLVINSKFQPFSFERYIQPYQMYEQAYQGIETALGDLESKASVWENLANEQTDPKAYNMYKKYADDLRGQADLLAKEGLNNTSRKKLMNIWSRYSKEITPIEQAYNRRNQLAEEQRQLRLRDPYRFFQNEASAMSLDTFINNPTATYGESASGTLLAQQVGQMAANLKGALTGRGKMTGKGLAYQYEQLLQYGYTPEQIRQAILNPTEGNPVLTTIVDQVIKGSGMEKWATPEQLAQARYIASQGLYNAIGKTDIQNFTDQFSMQDRLNARQHARAVAEQRRREREAARQQGKGFALNPTNIYSQRELNEAEKKYKENIENYKNYFYKDKNGNIKMTWAGRKEYYSKKFIPNTTTPFGPKAGSGEWVPSDFRTFMDNLGARKYIGTNKMTSSGEINWQPGNLGNLWARYVNKSPASKTAKYDAQKDTEYTIFLPQTDEYQKDFKGKVQGTAGSMNALVEVDYDPKTRSWVTTGNTLSLSDFYKDDYKIISRNPSTISNSKGNMTTWMIAKDGENAKRYMSIPGIHRSAEAGRNEAAMSMWQTQQLLANPNLSQSARTRLENAYDDWTQQLYMFDMQLDVTNKTSDQSVSPYYIP